VAVSPDDKTVAVASSTQGVELWDLDGRMIRQMLPGHHGTVLALAFAPDGKTLAAGYAGGPIELWDPATGYERAGFQGDRLAVRALAFSPDCQPLAPAGSGHKGVKLWQANTGQELAPFPTRAAAS